MKESKQYKESSSVIIPWAQSKEQIYFEDNRAKAIAQSGLIACIQKREKRESVLQLQRIDKSDAIQCVLPPHKFHRVPNFHMAIDFPWDRGLRGKIDNIRVWPNFNLPDGTPMMATKSDWKGFPLVEYHPEKCANLSKKAAYFVLLHEIAHIDAPEQYNPAISSKDKEAQADDSAALNLITYLPNIAMDCLQEIHDYFVLNDSPGGDTHPSDSDRAKRISDIQTQVDSLEEMMLGIVHIAYDTNYSAGLLESLKYEETEIKQNLVEAKRSGYISLEPLYGGLINYRTIGELLNKIDSFEQTSGAHFSVEIEWVTYTPKSIFTSLDAPKDDIDTEILTRIAGLSI